MQGLVTNSRRSVLLFRTILVILLLANFLSLIFGYHLSTSLWLDETITAWIIDSSLTEVWSRSINFQAQSPLYYILMYFYSVIFGRSEIALRIPSLIAGILSLLLVTKFTKQHLVSLISIIVMLLLMSHSDFISALFAVRPYMFAFLASLSTAYLTNLWLERGRIYILTLAIVSFLATFYLHYIFIFPLLGLISILAIFKGIAPVQDKAKSLLLLLSAGLMLIPGLFHLRLISTRADAYTFAAPLSISSVVEAFIVLEPSLILLVSFALVLICLPKAQRGLSFEGQRAVYFSLLWIIVPPLSLIILSLCTGHSLMIRRYFLLAAPGVALFGAWALGLFKNEQARFCLVLLVAVFMLMLPRVWVREEWREAVSSIDEKVSHECVVMLNSGLIEAEHISWLVDNKNSEYLTAPLRVYAPPCKVLVVPKISSIPLQEFIEKTIIPQLFNYKKIYLLSYVPRSEAVSSELPIVVQSYSELLSDYKIKFNWQKRFGSVVSAEFQPIL
jgi:uncharacterized membrane protein